MSWEGVQHFICKNGHYSCEEDFGGGGYNLTPEDMWKCPICKEKAEHTVIIDWTNGEGIDPEVIPVTPPTLCTCNECGNRHVIKPATFRPGEGWS